MGSEIVIGVSGDIRGHSGTRLSALQHSPGSGEMFVSHIAQPPGGRGGWTQHKATMSCGLWVNITTVLLSQTVNGSFVPRNQLL